MEKMTLNALLARLAVVSLCACAATLAQAGGNGNGGNGSGGSHGAATAGMTYHSEPVTSPWSTVPGGMKSDMSMTDTAMPSMSANDTAKTAKAAQ
ncbi:hypothetical protein [Paraburkholderia sp. BL21I4N1]|uniref:hypothetical protein n=1 Tax=Paraburkholderia sp. BL21I4N1 TaxID=1938801 RepID=UPI000CFAD95C|nr:hypothetical protein [Paraburkholderia sp. BL21I4N1]PQV53906.1 hypothetical protein B0G83_10188 [Paraburkholderia sp. BL21I4N1]